MTRLPAIARLLLVAASCLGVVTCRAGEPDQAAIPVRTREVADRRELAALLQPDTSARAYRAPRKTDRWQLILIVPELLELTAVDPLTLARLGQWNATAHRMGFELEMWRVEGDTYAALRELPGRQRGAGIYVFRVATPEPGQPLIALQAPHTYHDANTKNLAMHVFFTAAGRRRLRALYLNSMHRYQVEAGKLRRPEEHTPADVCHNPEHLFQAATRLLVHGGRPARVVQLHGFGKHAVEAAGVDAVISSDSDELEERLTATLRKSFSGQVFRRHPEETTVLGGKGNAQAGMLASYATAHFVHVELSRPFRKLLLGRDQRMERFSAALIDSVSFPVRAEGTQ